MKSRNWLIAVLAAAVVLGLYLGSVHHSTNVDRHIEELRRNVEGVPAGMHSVRITRTQYGDAWPFTVEEGVLTYDRGVLFTTGGTTYPVNGTAIGNYPNLPDIRAIWADDRRHPGMGLKKDIGPIVERGLRLRP